MKNLMNSIGSKMEQLKVALENECATFCEQSEYDNQSDIIYEIPRVYSVDKHGYHIEWCILNIDKGIVYLAGIGEDYGETKELKIGDLNSDELIAIGNELV